MEDSYYRDIVVNKYSKSERSGMKQGLSRMYKILDLLDNPQNKLKAIHIAGTNGKGSICNYLHSILSVRYKVGMYTSPSIIDLNDRIIINGENITFKEIYEYYNYLAGLWISSYGPSDFPTFFELFTAIALYHFAKNNVDFAIIEVGLGGKNDATNIFNNKPISIISKIGYDHMNILGNHILDIAKEKLDIINSSEYAISSPQIYEVCKYMKEYSKDIDFIDENDIKNVIVSKFKTKFDYKYHKRIVLKMPGYHQVLNCCAAIECIDKLNQLNITDITDSEILSSLSNSKLVGRLEWFDNILLDGAHNLDGIESLIKYLHACNFKKIKILLAILTDKEYNKIIHKMEKIDASFYITDVPDFNENKDILSKCFSKPVTIFENYKIAMDNLNKNLKRDEILIVTGSLYLISKVRKYLEEFNENK